MEHKESCHHEKGDGGHIAADSAKPSFLGLPNHHQETSQPWRNQDMSGASRDSGSIPGEKRLSYGSYPARNLGCNRDTC